MKPDGPPVETWTEIWQGGPQIVVRFVERCPTCGADWSQPHSVRRGGSASGGQYYCWSCETNHPEKRQDGPGAPSM